MKIIKEIVPYLVIVAVVVLIRTFIITPVVVSGPSMNPTLKNGQVLILNKLAHNYQRHDIVVVKANINGRSERIVKRIIGLPLERVEYRDHKLYINNKKTRDDFSNITEDFSLDDINEEVIPKDCYLVLGDNRNNSLDSRDVRLGIVKKSDIIGEPIFRIWPLNKLGKVN